jgi:RHS repeat-associated protein
MWRWDTDPFGTVADNENPSGLGATPYYQRFPGQYYDSGTALSYNYYRDYDPAVGRYVESDPIGLRSGVNTYSYVRANATNSVDPFGLDDVVGWIECDGRAADSRAVPMVDVSPTQKKCGIGNCVRQHEMVHVRDFNSAFPPPTCHRIGPGTALKIPGLGGVQSEVEGYRVQYACLLQLLNSSLACSRECSNAIADAIKDTLRNLAKYEKMLAEWPR